MSNDRLTIVMALASMLAGGIILSLATWALLGHPETIAGYPAGGVLVAAPILGVLLVLGLTVAAAYGLVWAVKTAPRNRPDVEVEYSGTSTFDQYYEALQERNMQLLLGGAIVVFVYHSGARYLEARSLLSGDVMLIVNVLTLLMGVPIAVGAVKVIYDDLHSPEEPAS